jgi:formylglycine-generating enzyme required for sulfatase activity
MVLLDSIVQRTAETIGTDRLKVAAWITRKDILNTAPREGPMGDAIFLGFMHGANIDRLAVDAPSSFKRYFRRLYHLPEPTLPAEQRTFVQRLATMFKGLQTWHNNLLRGVLSALVATLALAFTIPYFSYLEDSAPITAVETPSTTAKRKPTAPDSETPTPQIKPEVQQKTPELPVKAAKPTPTPIKETQSGKIFVEAIPDNAAVKILNIKPKFYQGMELEAGSYEVEVASEGYETQRQWIKLEAGDEKRFKFELAKIKIPEPIQVQKLIKNSIGMEFVLIPAGSFTMGSPLNEPGRDLDEQQHPVTIKRPFYLQTTEVTQKQWRQVMGSNRSWSKDCGDDCPVENVSWDDAQEFIKKLNQMESGEKYRLPTEAEWEYACRAGTRTSYYTGETEEGLNQAGWYSKNSGNKLHPVGEKKPNAWGLYDMHGNVWEWVEDDWHDTYKRAPDDGSAWIDNRRGYGRVIRGGSWLIDARNCRSATRFGDGPGRRDDFVGFRLSRSVSLGP